MYAVARPSVNAVVGNRDGCYVSVRGVVALDVVAAHGPEVFVCSGDSDDAWLVRLVSDRDVGQLDSCDVDQLPTLGFPVSAVP